MSVDDDSKEVDTSDTKESKLEIALGLAKLTIGGTWAVWTTAIIVSLVGAAFGADVSVPSKIAETLLPINTGTTGALLGYVLGKKE